MIVNFDAAKIHIYSNNRKENRNNLVKCLLIPHFFRKFAT